MVVARRLVGFDWGVKHPFTGYAGIGACAETPRAGKRQVAAFKTRRFPIHGEAVPKGLKGYPPPYIGAGQ
jgi:hypothetical protein